MLFCSVPQPHCQVKSIVAVKIYFSKHQFQFTKWGKMDNCK